MHNTSGLTVQPPQLIPYRHPWYKHFTQISTTLWCWMSAGVLIVSLLGLYFHQRIDVFGAGLSLLGYLPILVLLHSNLKRQWESKLPIYMDVSYNYQGVKRLQLYGIPLLNESDLRAQAQSAVSLFLTAGNKQSFPMLPIIVEPVRTLICVDRHKNINQGQPVKKYQFTIELTDDAFKRASHCKPDQNILEPQVLQHLDKLARTDHYLYAYYPFDLNQHLQVRTQEAVIGS